MNNHAKVPVTLTIMQRIEIWLAAKTLPMWAYGRDLESTLKYFDKQVEQKFLGTDINELTCHIIKATRKPWFMRDRRCLRQGLLAMLYLRKAGHDPTLHFGIDIDSVKKVSISAHCWVENNGQALVNDILDNMVEIYSVPMRAQANKVHQG